MEDLRCYTLHFYFRIKGAELFEGEDGFSACSMKECINDIEKITIEQYNEFSNVHRGIVAHNCGVPVENVIPISRDEYKENTDEEGEE